MGRVHLMLGGVRPSDSLRVSYLNQGRKDTGGNTLSQILAARGTTAKSLVAHLQSIGLLVVARKPPASPQERLFRLQDRGQGRRLFRLSREPAESPWFVARFLSGFR